MKKTKKRSEPQPQRHKPSKQAQLERALGRKLLRGEIPVVPPKILRCPAPNSPEFDETCKKYEKGEMSYEDVLTKVGESMKKKEPEGENVGGAQDTSGVTT